MRTTYTVGGEVTKSKDTLILCFSIRKLQFLWTVVFGTDTIAETLALPTIKNIGRKNEKEISNTTKKLQLYLSRAGGRLFVYGNAN